MQSSVVGLFTMILKKGQVEEKVNMVLRIVEIHMKASARAVLVEITEV